jgi:hypothetical protein
MSNQETKEPQTNAINEAEAKKQRLVNFVANNILNSITLNQTITVVQQIALRDANTIVSEADDEKLKQIEESYEAALKSSQEAAEAQSSPPEASKAAPAKKSSKKKTTKTTA